MKIGAYISPNSRASPNSAHTRLMPRICIWTLLPCIKETKLKVKARSQGAAHYFICFSYYIPKVLTQLFFLPKHILTWLDMRVFFFLFPFRKVRFLFFYLCLYNYNHWVKESKERACRMVTNLMVVDIFSSELVPYPCEACWIDHQSYIYTNS